MKEIIKEEFDFIDEIIERTKESDYINLLARKRKARLQGKLLILEQKGLLKKIYKLKGESQVKIEEVKEAYRLLQQIQELKENIHQLYEANEVYLITTLRLAEANAIELPKHQKILILVDLEKKLAEKKERLKEMGVEI